MTREHAFYNHLRRWQDRPFELGVHDCSTFVCEWVDVALGTDYKLRVGARLAEMRPLAVMRRIATPDGYESLIAEFIGPASREGEYDLGDPALFTQADGTVTFGVLGQRLVYAPGKDGLMAMGAEHALCYWRLASCRR